MPKSKKNKQVDLTKTKKKGLERKNHLYAQIRENVDMYKNIFIFSVNDMRNSKMKSVRTQWRHSRFFIGKNKVMAMALGRTEEEEYRSNLHKIGERLKGERGLFFTNETVEAVLKWFRSYSEADFARSGNVATEDVHLKEGPMPEFSYNLEPYFRQLGLPTSLQKGIIHLVKDHVVCKQGDILSPETARILKFLGYEMAEFNIKMECAWSQDGSFENLTTDSVGSEGKENVQKQEVSMTPSGSSKDNIEKDEAEQHMEVEEVEEKQPVEERGEAKQTLQELGIKFTEVTPNIDDDQDLDEGIKEESIVTSVRSNSPEKSSDQQSPESSEEDVEVEEKELEKKEEQPVEEKSSDQQSTESSEKDFEEEEEEAVDKTGILELTQSKLKELTPKPKKFSPKMTRARAMATNTRIKTPESLENITRSARKAAKKNNI